MDKRFEKNLAVKRAITEAFFKLMRKRESKEISVVDIVREAGVARVSYYRNFNSKDDIVASFIDEVLSEFESGVVKNRKYYYYANIVRSFEFFRDYMEYIIDIRRFHFTRILWGKLNRFHERMDGDLPLSSPERYRIYAYIGALLNTAIVWIDEGLKETPEEMALQFCKMTRISPIS